MRSFCSLLFAFCLTASLTGQAQAQDQEEEPWSFNFFLENDLFANTDLNYTNGIRLSTISPDLENFQDPNGQKYPWVEKLNNLLTFIHPAPRNPANNPVNQNMVISLGQLMFTPRDKFAAHSIPTTVPMQAISTLDWDTMHAPQTPCIPRNSILAWWDQPPWPGRPRTWCTTLVAGNDLKAGITS